LIHMYIHAYIYIFTKSLMRPRPHALSKKLLQSYADSQNLSGFHSTAAESALCVVGHATV